jgi:hypothetical protein
VLLLLDNLFPKTETNLRCFLWKHNNPEVNYSTIWIARKGEGVSFRGNTTQKLQQERLQTKYELEDTMEWE